MRSILVCAAAFAPVAGWRMPVRVNPALVSAGSRRAGQAQARRRCVVFASTKTNDPRASSPFATGLTVKGASAPDVLNWLMNEWCRQLPRDGPMPLTPQVEPWGVCLRFVACPSDSISIVVQPMGKSDCAVVVKRGEGGKVRASERARARAREFVKHTMGLGFQPASLARTMRTHTRARTRTPTRAHAHAYPLANRRALGSSGRRWRHWSGPRNPPCHVA